MEKKENDSLDGCAGSLLQLGDGREQGDSSPIQCVLDEKQQGRPVALVTIVATTGSAPRGLGSSLAVKTDGSIVGTVGGGNLELFVIRHALESLQDGKSRRLHYDFSKTETQNVEKACGGTTDFFIQPFVSNLRLVIFGAGHVGRALAPMALACGFSVVIADDRLDFLRSEYFPNGVFLEHGSFPDLPDKVRLDEKSYVVIMTYGHSHDEEVLSACLKKPFAYLGLMGSKTKIAEFKERLGRIAAFEEPIEKLHAPIGLPLGGRSPAEIAISIMAELLAVRYGRELRFQTQKR